MRLDLVCVFTLLFGPALDSLVTSACVSCMLHAGVELGLDGNDLLLLNNRSAVHGRAGFRANYDGADRWLQRNAA